MIHLLEIYIILTQAKKIVIVYFNYNAYLSNQAEQKICQIRQSNKSKAHIFICIDILIE